MDCLIGRGIITHRRIGTNNDARKTILRNSISFQQAAVYRGEIQKREMLHLPVLIDQDVIDGVPAAQFVDDLVKKLQTGFGLPA